jgi:2-oxoglutarate ferredoxin oxidoreductase subunit delta
MTPQAARPQEETKSKPTASPAKAPPRIEVKVSWCKGCGLCVEYCNRDVLVMEGVVPRVVNAEKCSRCLQCEAICPDFAIRISDDEGAGEGGAAS